jgi:hypothetical protein
MMTVRNRLTVKDFDQRILGLYDQYTMLAWDRTINFFNVNLV